FKRRRAIGNFLQLKRLVDEIQGRRNIRESLLSALQRYLGTGFLADLPNRHRTVGILHEVSTEHLIKIKGPNDISSRLNGFLSINSRLNDFIDHWSLLNISSRFLDNLF